MFTEKILGIVNVHRRIRSDSSMQGVGMLDNDNVRRKNARNRQYKVGKCSGSSMCAKKKCLESSLYAEKHTESSMQGVRVLKMLGIIAAR